jgi:hypothetical protein
VTFAPAKIASRLTSNMKVIAQKGKILKEWKKYEAMNCLLLLSSLFGLFNLAYKKHVKILSEVVETYCRKYLG